MLKLFSSKNPLIVVLYPIIAFILIYINSDNFNYISLIHNKPYLYLKLISLFNGNYFNAIYISLSVTLLSINSIFFNRLIQKLKIVKSFQNLYGLIFLLLFGFYIKFIDILQLSLSLLFFIITIFLLVQSLRKGLAVFDFFTGGLFLSVASFFWFQILYFYPIIIIGLLIFRTLNFREITTSLIGIFIPYLFFFSIYFFIFFDFGIIFDTHTLIFHKNSGLHINLNSLIPSIILIIITLISTVYIANNYRRTESDIQDYYIFFFLLFLLSLVYLIFLYKNDLNFIIITLMTTTIPLGIFFAGKSNPIFKEVLFDLLLLAVIISQTSFFYKIII